jgi:uncharacterized protein (DUF2336 family)
MAAPALIPELEEVIQSGSAERRVHALQKITDLFLHGAGQFNEAHVDLFDDVFGRLINEIEAKARSELSNRLAPVGNAPIRLVRRLAKDDDILVAGPILQHSQRLPDSDLVHIAKTKSQAHLLAISGRSLIAEPVTDVLVRRGDQNVVRNVVDNRGARLSEDAFSTLLKRAEQDAALAEKVGKRPDIPPQKFRELVLRASAVVQQRLLASAPSQTQAEIQQVIAKVSSEVTTAPPARREYSVAQHRIAVLRREGRLNETQIVEFAKSGRFEELVAALANLCAVPVEVVDRLMHGDRTDPILILGKSAGWKWPTVKSVIMARSDGEEASSQGLDEAFANFERLSAATATRVMRFWQTRPTDAAGMR